jgi:hypothetical protein
VARKVKKLARLAALLAALSALAAGMVLSTCYLADAVERTVRDPWRAWELPLALLCMAGTAFFFLIVFIETLWAMDEALGAVREALWGEP